MNLSSSAMTHPIDRAVEALTEAFSRTTRSVAAEDGRTRCTGRDVRALSTPEATAHDGGHVRRPVKGFSDRAVDAARHLVERGMPGAGSQNAGGHAERSRQEYQTQARACAKKRSEDEQKAGWTSKEYTDMLTGERIVCRTERKYKNDWANARDNAIRYKTLSSMPELAMKHGYAKEEVGKAKAKLQQRRWSWDKKEGEIAYGLSEQSWRKLTCCPCGGKDANKLTVGGKGNPWAPKFKAGIEAAEKIGHQGVVCMKTRKNKPGEFVRCGNYTVPSENPAMAVAAPQPEPAHETSAVFDDPDDSQNEIESRALPGGQLYRGNIQDGKFHGKGTLSDKDDTVYEGDWRDGQYHGEGKLRDKDGRRYEGSFEHGKRQGQGTLTETDGSTIYEGEWQEDEIPQVRDGTGTRMYENGEVYKGEFVRGKRHGKGTLTRKGRTIYEGDWRDDEYCTGKGERKYEDGSVYKGEFVQRKRQGQGTLTDKDGHAIYEGDWKDDRYHGEGELTFNAKHDYDEIVYTGEFCDGEPHGTGKYTHKDRVYYAPEGRMEYADGTVYEGRVRMYLDVACYENRAPRNYWPIGVLKHGKGKLTYKDGSVYEGRFEFDEKTTEGKLTYKDGSVYKGGKLTYKDGRTYEGDWKDGQYHGKGKLRDKDGRRYEGSFEHGKRHGQGTWTLRDGCRYEGSFEQGKPHGKGKLTDKDGRTIYEGSFKQGKHQLHGQVTLMRKGTLYEGSLEHGKRHGQGKATSKDGRTIYEGDWKDGQYHGEGKLTDRNGHTYEGSFEQGQPHGEGTWTLRDGRRYEGSFEQGKAHGKGTWTLRDGRTIYEGSFEHGKRHGQGTWTLRDGCRYEGSFEQGQYHGEGKLTDKDGRTIYEGEWRDGKRYSDRAQTVDDVAEQMSTASLSDTGQATGRARSQASSGNPAPRARPRRASLETQSVPGDTAKLSDVTEAGDEAKSQRIIGAAHAERDELESQLHNTTADNRQRWDVTELRYDVNHSCETMATENVPEDEDQVRERAYLAQREFADALEHIGLTRHADTFAEAGIRDIDHLSNMEYDQWVELGLTPDEISSLMRYAPTNTGGDADSAAFEEELMDYLGE